MLKPAACAGEGQSVPNALSYQLVLIRAVLPGLIPKLRNLE